MGLRVKNREVYSEARLAHLAMSLVTRATEKFVNVALKGRFRLAAVGRSAACAKPLEHTSLGIGVVEKDCAGIFEVQLEIARRRKAGSEAVIRG
jgi:hypothetical protein